MRQKRLLVTDEEQRAKRREWTLKRKLRLEQEGLCVICGGEPSVEGKRLGKICSSRLQENNKIRHEWDKVIGDEREELGLCRKCGKEALIQGLKHCMLCKEKARLDLQKRREKRSANGLCYRCGKVPPAPNRKSLCEVCARKAYIETKRLALKTKYRQQALDHYGTMCACCGESNSRFLTFDHVNNDGAEHRKKDPRAKCNLAKWLINNDFPEGFQVLCYNCNFGKQVNGGICPHKDQQ